MNCPYGHEYTPLNTAHTREGWRVCKHCRTCRQRAKRKFMTLAEYYERWPRQRDPATFTREPQH